MLFFFTERQELTFLIDEISSVKEMRCFFWGTDEMDDMSSVKEIRCFFFGGTILSLRYVHGKKKVHVFMKNITHDEHREIFYVIENITMSTPNV